MLLTWHVTFLGQVDKFFLLFIQAELFLWVLSKQALAVQCIWVLCLSPAGTCLHAIKCMPSLATMVLTLPHCGTPECVPKSTLSCSQALQWPPVILTPWCLYFQIQSVCPVCHFSAVSFFVFQSYIYGYFAWMCISALVCAWCLWRLEEGAQSLELELVGSLPCGCWELNLCILGKQLVFLSSKSAHSSTFLYLLCVWRFCLHVCLSTTYHMYA